MEILILLIKYKYFLFFVLVWNVESLCLYIIYIMDDSENWIHLDMLRKITDANDHG